jgi:beta-glucanase (GH16 family)
MPGTDRPGTVVCMTDRSWSLVWADDFSGPAGSPPDPAKWNRNTGGHGWGNAELQYYTSAPENAFLDGRGHLVLRALRSTGEHQCWYGPSAYTSARLLTREKFAQTYGWFEARIQVPRGTGLWPAFWLYGDTPVGPGGAPGVGEIDVMEHVGHEPAVVYGSLHGADGFSTVAAYTLAEPEIFAAAFHVFALEWTPGSVTFLVDGRPYRTVSRHEAGPGWVFDHPFYLVINLAVGGRWPGEPEPATRFPADLLIDHVRAYRRSTHPPTS